MTSQTTYTQKSFCYHLTEALGAKNQSLVRDFCSAIQTRKVRLDVGIEAALEKIQLNFPSTDVTSQLNDIAETLSAEYNAWLNTALYAEANGDTMAQSGRCEALVRLLQVDIDYFLPVSKPTKAQNACESGISNYVKTALSSPHVTVVQREQLLRALQKLARMRASNLTQDQEQPLELETKGVKPKVETEFDKPKVKTEVVETEVATPKQWFDCLIQKCDAKGWPEPTVRFAITVLSHQNPDTDDRLLSEKTILKLETRYTTNDIADILRTLVPEVTKKVQRLLNNNVTAALMSAAEPDSPLREHPILTSHDLEVTEGTIGIFYDLLVSVGFTFRGLMENGSPDVAGTLAYFDAATLLDFEQIAIECDFRTGGFLALFRPVYEGAVEREKANHHEAAQGEATDPAQENITGTGNVGFKPMSISGAHIAGLIWKCHGKIQSSLLKGKYSQPEVAPGKKVLIEAAFAAERTTKEPLFRFRQMTDDERRVLPTLMGDDGFQQLISAGFPDKAVNVYKVFALTMEARFGALEHSNAAVPDSATKEFRVANWPDLVRCIRAMQKSRWVSIVKRHRLYEAYYDIPVDRSSSKPARKKVQDTSSKPARKVMNLEWDDDEPIFARKGVVDVPARAPAPVPAPSESQEVRKLRLAFNKAELAYRKAAFDESTSAHHLEELKLQVDECQCALDVKEFDLKLKRQRRSN
jgi:hypothetical protein